MGGGRHLNISMYSYIEIAIYILVNIINFMAYFLSFLISYNILLHVATPLEKYMVMLLRKVRITERATVIR